MAGSQRNYTRTGYTFLTLTIQLRTVNAIYGEMQWIPIMAWLPPCRYNLRFAAGCRWCLVRLWDNPLVVLSHSLRSYYYFLPRDWFLSSLKTISFLSTSWAKLLVERPKAVSCGRMLCLETKSSLLHGASVFFKASFPSSLALLGEQTVSKKGTWLEILTWHFEVK